jgi:hypothetical protein
MDSWQPGSTNFVRTTEQHPGGSFSWTSGTKLLSPQQCWEESLMSVGQHAWIPWRLVQFPNFPTMNIHKMAKYSGVGQWEVMMSRCPGGFWHQGLIPSATKHRPRSGTRTIGGGGLLWCQAQQHGGTRAPMAMHADREKWGCMEVVSSFSLIDFC